MQSHAATSTPAVTRRSATPTRVGASARAARRWFLIASPVVAGLFAILGAASDPAGGEGGRSLYAAYAANPDPLQFKAIGYHFAYAFWGFAALMLVGLVRRRGSWLANLAGVLVFLGVTTMPGFILADFYDSAIGQTFRADGALRVNEQMEEMWALIALASTGGIGFILALPVAVLAAWRAELLPWWAAVAATAGVIAGFMVIGATVPGTIVLTAGFAVLSVALARADLGAWQDRGVVAAPADEA